MYTGFDELSSKIDDLLNLVKEMDKKLWKNRSAIIDMCILMGFEDDAIKRLTGASKEDIELSRIFCES